MKKIINYLILTISVLFITTNVSAKTVICDIGNTNGVLFSTSWNFYVEKADAGKYKWKFSNSVMQYCPAGGCSGVNWNTTIEKTTSLDEFLNYENFDNIYSDADNETTYNNAELKQLFESEKCPEYIYLGTNKSTKKFGFIFSSQKLDTAKTELENKGYETYFIHKESVNMTQTYIDLYENHLQKMRDNIQEYNDKNYDKVVSGDCQSLTKFGGMPNNQNIPLLEYDQHKANLKEKKPDYNFSEGEQLVKEYKSLKCYIKGLDNGSNNGGSTSGNGNGEEIKDKYIGNLTCSGANKFYFPKLLPDFTKTLYNFIKLLIPIILIIKGMMDMLKATSSSKEDEMKKAQKKFIQRLIAGLCGFILFILVETIVGWIDDKTGNDGAMNCVNCFINGSENCSTR